MHWLYYYSADTNEGYTVLESYDSGSTWHQVGSSQRNISYYVAFDKESVTGVYYDQDSINKYGIRFKKITDSSITSAELALQKAKALVEQYSEVKAKGNVTILGNVDIDLSSILKLNLPSYGLSGQFDVRAFTHIIDNRGFRTRIQFTSHEYDIAAKVARLEKKVEEM